MKSKLLKRCRRDLRLIEKSRLRWFHSTKWLRYAEIARNEKLIWFSKMGFRNARNGVAWIPIY